LRIHGEIVETQHPELSGDQIAELIRGTLSQQEFAHFLEKHDFDYSITVVGVGRFRGNLLFQQNGISAVFRLIPYQVPTLEQLNAPDIFYQIANYPHGLVLVTGPTGSGKSTTLAAIIDFINAHQNLHILSIEDPIEFVHQKRKSMITQREVGGHTDSFATALRAALREDPDVILVGELRDTETIGLAMTAAETGHLVLGTLHTNSAIKTIDRILDSFPGDTKEQARTMLSESLRAVIAQRLLPKVGGGRIAAFEVMVSNRAIANLIRENKTVQIKNSMISGRAEGMRLMDTSIQDLFKAGIISGETAYDNADDRGGYQQFAPKTGAAQQAQPMGSTAAAPYMRSPSITPQPPPTAPEYVPNSQGAEDLSKLSPLERLRRLKRSA
jgi:twitching motility protein PilT